jgi:hypothetical protein
VLRRRWRGLERPELGHLLLEALVLLGELLAPALHVLAVDLRLLELGPGAAVLEPHLYLSRPQPEAVGQCQFLLLQKSPEIHVISHVLCMNNPCDRSMVCSENLPE